MSETTSVAPVPVAVVGDAVASVISAVASAAVTSPLSGELKAAVSAAVSAHVASVQSDAAKITGAMEHDLSTVVTGTVTEFEKLDASFKSEVAKLRADLVTYPNAKYYLAAAGVSVAVFGSLFLHFVVHAF